MASGAGQLRFFLNVVILRARGRGAGRGGREGREKGGVGRESEGEGGKC